jgi:hypothetical protein
MTETGKRRTLLRTVLNPKQTESYAVRSAVSNVIKQAQANRTRKQKFVDFGRSLIGLKTSVNNKTLKAINKMITNGRNASSKLKVINTTESAA